VQSILLRLGCLHNGELVVDHHDDVRCGHAYSYRSDCSIVSAEQLPQLLQPHRQSNNICTDEHCSFVRVVICTRFCRIVQCRFINDSEKFSLDWLESMQKTRLPSTRGIEYRLLTDGLLTNLETLGTGLQRSAAFPARDFVYTTGAAYD